MSGSGGKSKARAAAAGWEEATGEFYQELYPGGEQELFENLQRADAGRLATLLPSKHARNTTTVKRVRSQTERRQSTFAPTTQSRDHHLSMLPDLSENLSNEERTWEEIMLIKAMPVPMVEKRELKAQLQNATKLRLVGLEQLQWRQRKAWHRVRAAARELATRLELWRTPLRDVEGRFGTGVLAYFRFLRWLFLLNFLVSTIVVVFLILPKVLLVEQTYLCDANGIGNTTACCSQAYLERNQTDSNVILDLIQGTGYMERTILFYGVYSDQTYTYYLKNFLDTEMYYNMPLAYIVVPICWALLTLVCIVNSGAKGFKERLVESEGQFYMYCNIVFGGWDFCIHNDKSAKIKHKAIYNEIKGCIEEDRYKEEKQMRSRESQMLLFLKRVFINLLVFVILVGAGIFIYLVFNYSLDQLEENSQNVQKTDLLHLNVSNTLLNRLISLQDPLGELRLTFLEFLPFLCIVLLNIVVPELFGYLIKFESYNPSKVVIITILRTVLLRLSSLAVLLWQIYINITERHTLICAATATNEDSTSIECWETYVGQQLYKLILTDFAVQFVTTFLINFPRSFTARHTSNKCLKIVCEQHFYLPKHVLDIVYIQTIVWMGSFFCPLLPVIGTIFYFLIFYIKKFTCLRNSTPSPIVYKASKSKSLFMSVLLLGFIISIAPVAYSIAEIVPSINCGPFRGLNTVWQFVIDTFETFPSVLREFVFLLGTSTFAVPAFAVILLFLYYYWAVAQANRHMVIVLKNQLVLEGHDKQFLLNRLSAFIRQHQKRCERRNNRASFADNPGDNVSARQSSR